MNPPRTGDAARPPAAATPGAARVRPAGPFAPFPRDALEGSIPDRFEAIVRQYPDRPAVRTACKELTYEALNGAANRVARTVLNGRGGREAPIALLAADHVPMMIAILGAWKAGAIAVPLNPMHPEERTARLLEDSGADLVVTIGDLLSLARRLTQGLLPVITMDGPEARQDPGNPGLRISPDAVSHVLYTSGTTGRPKGVIQTHRNLLHNVRVNTNGFRLSGRDRITLFASCTVGQGIVNTFMGLLNGATLYPFDIRQEGVAGLAGWLTGHEITVYISAVTIFRHFVETLNGGEAFPHLRLMNLRSEPVRRSDVELFRKHLPPSCLLANALSAAETGNVAQYLIDHTTPVPGGSLPVGYAVPDTELLLLDDAGARVAPQEVGEIAVKSRYLAVGYWRQPDLTRKAFLPDPDGGQTRMYRTGDLGRFLPDGALVHLGRKNSSVRVRGLAADLADIEAALLDEGRLREVVVVLREDRSGDPRLVAYCVPRQQSAPTVPALRVHLARMMPPHMIPSSFVVLAGLPRTPNGKVDQGALPAPPRTRPEVGSPFVAPRTPVEGQLAAIWADVLSLEQVGIHDDFLELGGHSLLAMRILARAITTFRVEVPLQGLLEAPTIAAMAARIVRRQAGTAGNAEIGRILADLDGLSEEEAERRLSQEIARGRDPRGDGRHGA